VNEQTKFGQWVSFRNAVSRAESEWVLEADLSTMKLDQLRSIGHNMADSLASCIGLPIGIYMARLQVALKLPGEGEIASRRNLSLCVYAS
jgi:hypothetical protein